MLLACCSFFLSKIRLIALFTSQDCEGLSELISEWSLEQCLPYYKYSKSVIVLEYEVKSVLIKICAPDQGKWQNLLCVVQAKELDQVLGVIQACLTCTILFYY